MKPRAHSSIRPAYSPSDSGRLRHAQRLAHNDRDSPQRSGAAYGARIMTLEQLRDATKARGTCVSLSEGG